MGQRLALHNVLVELLGSECVYFQPPSNVVMSYPCIIYEWTTSRVFHADDRPYHRERRYMVTVIDRNPDSLIPDKVLSLRKCSHSRSFQADNLNHWVFDLYY